MRTQARTPAEKMAVATATRSIMKESDNHSSKLTTHSMKMLHLAR